MSQTGPNPYMRTKILTASPEELRLMLYEGAIRFCRQARQSMAAKDREAAYNSLMRAQKIVLELSTSLNHQVDPELCDKLSSLYTFIYRRLVDANVNQDTAAVDEALQLLDYEKQTWQMLMTRMAAESRGNTAHPTAGNVAGAQQTAISSLSTRI